MDRDKHIEYHKLLYFHLDELVTDMIRHTGKLPSETTVMELLRWSEEQTLKPSEEK